MSKILYRPNLFQRNFQRLASTALMTSLLVKIAAPLDHLAARLSGGRIFLTSLLSGLPVVQLTTTGAKSGQPRRVSLVAGLDGEQVILIASNFGSRHNPAWYYNLRAHPQVSLEIAGQVRSYLAREAEGEERQRYWQRAVQLYAGYAAYERRASHRRIPVIVLMPE